MNGQETQNLNGLLNLISPISVTQQLGEFGTYLISVSPVEQVQLRGARLRILRRQQQSQVDSGAHIPRSLGESFLVGLPSPIRGSKYFANAGKLIELGDTVGFTGVGECKQGVFGLLSINQFDQLLGVSTELTHEDVPLGIEGLQGKVAKIGQNQAQGRIALALVE